MTTTCEKISTVCQVYGIGYLEYIHDSGQTGRGKAIGPRNEADEAAEHEKWKVSRMACEGFESYP